MDQGRIKDMKVNTVIDNAKKIREKRTKSFSLLSSVTFVFLALFSIFLFALMFWGLVNSLKDRFDFKYNNLFGLPASWQFDHYILVFSHMKKTVEHGLGFRTVYLEEMYLNSILYAGGCAVAQTMCACLTAYVTTKYRFKFSSVINFVVILAMILPIVGALPSEIRIVRLLNLDDNIFGQWILKSNFLGIYYLIFQATFKQMPNEFSEAAVMDGAGDFKRLFHIALPLATNTIFTVILIQFIAFWNDYQIPLIYLPSHPTVSYGLYHFVYENPDNDLSSVPMRLAGCYLMMLPVLVLFIIFRNKMIGNISMGGLKE